MSRARWALATALATALLGTARAHADPPPPPVACTPAPVALRVAMALGAGTLARIAAARDGDRVVVVARVLPGAHVPRASASTRIVLGEIGADGAWATEPRDIGTLPGRVDGFVELAAHDGVRAVVYATARGARWVSVGRDAASDRVVALVHPTRRENPEPRVAVAGDGFTLVWHRPGVLEVQHLAASHDAEPSAAVPSRVPGGSDVLAAAAGGAEGTTALVVRSPGRHYFVALADARGHVAWTGNAPAGCNHGRCPEVRLLPADGGYVATWLGRVARDGLAEVGARALGTDGRVRGRAPALIPMAHGVVIAGPQGQPLALQLGRPIVLRGAVRPVALPLADGAPREFPALATAWIAPPSREIELLSATRDGALTLARLRCEAVAP